MQKPRGQRIPNVFKEHQPDLCGEAVRTRGSTVGHEVGEVDESETRLEIMQDFYL